MSIVVPSRYFCSIFERCLLNEMYATNIMYSVTEDNFSQI